MKMRKLKIPPLLNAFLSNDILKPVPTVREENDLWDTSEEKVEEFWQALFSFALHYHLFYRNFFGWLSPSPNFLSLNVMKLSPLFSFPFPVWDLTTPPQKNSNLWFLSTIVPDVFPSPDYIPLFA